MKILVVEDSATLRLTMRKMIEVLDHTSIFANTGEEALQMIGVHDFDLVIMDVEMPGLDGFETTSLMREALEDRWVPIIFATGHTSDESLIAGIEAGGDDYLIKPITRRLLEAKLKAAQRITVMQQQLDQANDELAALKQYDELTQLLNRQSFIEKASQSMMEAHRHAKPCALMILEIDFFKQYHDSYGSTHSKKCLQKVADTIKQTAKREIDIVGRYSKAKFIIMLPQTDQDGAKVVAEKIIHGLEALAIANRKSAVRGHITVSAGIDIVKSQGHGSLDTLLLNAAKNLKLAKEQGGNRALITQTILIADGNGKHRDKLTKMLQPLATIISTDNQQQSVDLANSIRPDLILLNIEQPRIDSTTTDAIISQYPETPVLFIGAESSFPNAGQHANLSKSSPDALCERVIGLLK